MDQQDPEAKTLIMKLEHLDLIIEKNKKKKK